MLNLWRRLRDNERRVAHQSLSSAVLLAGTSTFAAWRGLSHGTAGAVLVGILCAVVGWSLAVVYFRWFREGRADRARSE